MNDTEISVNKLYCDGGVIGHNPSPIGGTWAYRRVIDQMVVDERSGIITPDSAQTPCVTNNLTEMLALVYGLLSLPPIWLGTIYSDSQITLGRASLGWKWKNIPSWLYKEFGCAAKRLVNFKDIKYVLLQGHPTKSELLAGVGSKGYPVSEHNVWCDLACGQRAREFMLAFKKELA